MLVNSAGGVINALEVNTVVTDLRFLSVGGSPDSSQEPRRRLASTAGNFGSTVGLRRINWREVNLGNRERPRRPGLN